MMDKIVVVVTPHPDDETLGCGGTLLALKKQGYCINWLIVTDVSVEEGFEQKKVNDRRAEIEKVTSLYGFDQVINFKIPTAKVDELSKGELVGKFSNAFNQLKPAIVFIPFINDVHTDHKIISEAVLSCTKWFRYPFIEKVLFYETISETDYNIDSTSKIFTPNVYVDISDHIDKKLEIMEIYKSEMGEFPFPRSRKAIQSLSEYRGSQCGTLAAEAFELLRATIKL